MTTASEVRDSFKYLYPDELPFLQRLVYNLPDDPVVVNIGAGAGTSGLAILEARPDVTLVTIDVTDESSPFGCLSAERDVVDAAGLGHLWQDRWFQILSDSKQVAYNWTEVAKVVHRVGSDHKVDMVFVDGDHSLLGAAGDIIGWMRWVKDGGTMAVHDYDKGSLAPDVHGPHPMPWPMVNRAVDILLVPYFSLIGRVDSLIAFTMDSSLYA